MVVTVGTDTHLDDAEGSVCRNYMKWLCTNEKKMSLTNKFNWQLELTQK